MADLDPSQLDRYSRQVVLDEIGPEGQQALLDASVLVVGAGGLGAPAIQYLAAAGVGTLGILDHDVAERSNLQRQVIHGDADVGRPKVASAADFVADLNPDVTVEAHETRLRADNASGIVANYDVVIDASDNFATRYLLSDACTLAGIPVSHGAVYRFEGQVTTFGGDGPCYRCLFPSAPPEGAVPNCASVGVLGAVPGTIGTLQATEAIKQVVGVGDTLAGRLLVFDAAGMTLEEVSIAADDACPVCGTDPAIASVAEATYEDDCSLPS
jgi:adenylyltransferase/sulfurtransferase